ncbi:deoxyguanosinetriphosphate triphosphohydrolase [soil metagenome]
MDLNKIYSEQRTGSRKNTQSNRTVYQRDFDRIIFSSSFRRLQNKTQVFPLPGSTFVHNRLTHSLEVSSVGRSLGKITGEKIADKYSDSLSEESKLFYSINLSEVIAAACLAHDLGNPAFGHSGEKAISYYFENHPEITAGLNDKERNDILSFEGNANAFRILTHKLNGRQDGGLRLTYTTLAAILKYPCESAASDKKFVHRKKFGFFQSEKETFEEVVTGLGMIREDHNDLLIYKRHPFTYLLEAADDIAYTLMDFEDAHRLGILSQDLIISSFTNLLENLESKKRFENIQKTSDLISDINEKIGYLRSVSINALTLRSADIYISNLDNILTGKYTSSLIKDIQKNCSELINIEKISVDKIYGHISVIEIELAGYNVINELLDMVMPAAIKRSSERNDFDKKMLQLVPEQYGNFADSLSDYNKIMSVIDYVSGMTDLFATELYRKIKGIDIRKH